jgi:hypothetical protein
VPQEEHIASSFLEEGFGNTFYASSLSSRDVAGMLHLACRFAAALHNGKQHFSIEQLSLPVGIAEVVAEMVG